MERFLAIPGFEGCYEISDRGRVKSLARIDAGGHRRKERFLKYWENADGYPMAALTLDGKAFHRPIHVLVALAFHGPRPEGKEVNHIDCVRTNNHPDNLEYLTHVENIAHSVANGANYVTRGNARINFATAAIIRHIKSSTERTNECIGREFGLKKSMIGAIIRGKSWA